MASIFYDRGRKKWFAQAQVDGQRFGKRFEDKHSAKRWGDELEFDLKRALKIKNPAAHLYTMEKGRLPNENQFAAVTAEYIQKRALRFTILPRKRHFDVQRHTKAPRASQAV